MFKSVMGVIGLGLVGTAAFSAGASATVLFSDNFNAYSYNPAFTSTQPGTGLTVQAGGTVAGWVNSTNNNSLNAVDRGNGNYAIMFFDGTVLYYNTPLAANDIGVSYTISFTGSLATSSDPSQVTSIGDYVQFLVKDVSGTVASYNYAPSLTTTAFLPGSFTYTGTGTGSVYLVIKDGLDANGRFGGAIDDISVSSNTPIVTAEKGVVASPVFAVTAVPEPASLLLLASGVFGLAVLRRRNNAA